MGREGRADHYRMIDLEIPPDRNAIEVTVFGPGYGECIILHIGNGNWIIVDSCLNDKSSPVALDYLRNLGLNPAEVVRLIVATHWHDDHIKGIGKLVEICDGADFCCASVLCTKELLAMVGAVSGRPMSQSGSGLQELYTVMSLLAERRSNPKHALANRRIFYTDNCEIWSLSPFDRDYTTFLRKLDSLIPKESETKRRISSLTPNRVSVVLLFKIDDTAILLGSDLEGRGWLEILDSQERPRAKASVFKVPHHGSQNSHQDRVWNEMLDRSPVAVVTPWRRGSQSLPKPSDVRRVLSYTPKAYATATVEDSVRRSLRRRGMVGRTIRESGIEIRRLNVTAGMIRLRKQIGSESDWGIELVRPGIQLGS